MKSPQAGGNVLSMALPLLVILIAAISSVMFAYGTDPASAQFDHGISLIIWSARAAMAAAGDGGFTLLNPGGDGGVG